MALPEAPPKVCGVCEYYGEDDDDDNEKPNFCGLHDRDVKPDNPDDACKDHYDCPVAELC